MVKRALELTIVLVVALAPALTRAQDAATRARQLFEAGVAAMDRGQPSEAASYFDQSYNLFPRASTACNMAVAQERLGRPCDAQAWYRNCEALDRTGELSGHARQQSAALAAQCPISAPHDPFVRSQPASSGTVVASGNVRVVEGGAVDSRPPPGPSPDHTLLGVGIGALVIGGGALVGAIFSALAAQDEAAQLPAGGGYLPAGSPEANHYERAATFHDLALGLYVGAGLVGGLGLVLVAVDLAQPGVLGPSAARDGDVRLAITPTPGGAFGELTLRF